MKKLLLFILVFNLACVPFLTNSCSDSDYNLILYDYDSNKIPYSSVLAVNPNNETELQLFFDNLSKIS